MFLNVDINTTGKTFFRVQEEAATTILQLQPSHYGKLLLRLSHFKTLLRIFDSLVLYTPEIGMLVRIDSTSSQSVLIDIHQCDPISYVDTQFA